jgi:hypothetical protein
LQDVDLEISYQSDQISFEESGISVDQLEGVEDSDSIKVEKLLEIWNFNYLFPRILGMCFVLFGPHITLFIESHSHITNCIDPSETSTIFMDGYHDEILFVK